MFYKYMGTYIIYNKYELMYFTLIYFSKMLNIHKWNILILKYYLFIIV